MQVTIPDEIQQNSSLALSVTSATNYINREFRSSVLSPSACWTIKSDELGKPLVELEITDAPDSVSQRFTPEELNKTWYMEGRLNRLWTRLLNRKVERHLNRVTQLIGQMEGNGV